MCGLCHWHQTNAHSGDHGEEMLGLRLHRRARSVRSAYGEMPYYEVDVVADVEVAVTVVVAMVAAAVASYFDQR